MVAPILQLCLPLVYIHSISNCTRKLLIPFDRLCCCRCCRVCARTEGEPCGGVLGFSGECEPGLFCQQQTNNVDVDFDSSEGICQRVDAQ